MNPVNCSFTIIFLILERDEEIQKELEKLKQENEELRKFVNEHRGKLAVLTFQASR